MDYLLIIISKLRPAEVLCYINKLIDFFINKVKSTRYEVNEEIQV